MQLLDTIAHRGDLVDSDYSKLPQYHSTKVSSKQRLQTLLCKEDFTNHSFRILSQSTCIALDTDQSLTAGMWASSKSNSSLTKRSKTLELATDTRSVFKEQPSFLGGSVKKRKVTHLPLSPSVFASPFTFGGGEAFKNKTGCLFRWNQAFTRVFSSQAQLSTKHTQRKAKTYVKQIPKTTENLSFSKLYQGCIENLFSLTSLTNLQGKSIPFFFNPCIAPSPLVMAKGFHQRWCDAITKGEETSPSAITEGGGKGGWMTMTDAFRLSSLHQQANKTLALREADPIHLLKASFSSANVSYTNTKTQSEHGHKTTPPDLQDSPQPGLNMKLEGTLLQIQYKKNPYSTTLNHSVVISYFENHMISSLTKNNESEPTRL
jgi:hypothetical protein